MTRGHDPDVKIRKRVYASGKIGWQLDLGHVGGKRIQRSYESKADAEEALDEEKSQRKRHGQLGVDLSPRELAELVAARDRVEKAGGTLAEAVEYWMTHAVRVRHPVMMAEMMEGFIHARDMAHCSRRYLEQLRVSLGSLARAVPMEAHQVTRSEIERWLNASGWAVKTRNNYLGDVRALFAWAAQAGHVARSPCDGIPKHKEAEGEIGTLRLAECERLLNAVLHRPELAGYVIIGLFTGLRRAELEKLDWRMVSTDERTVVVTGASAKSRRRRVVDLSENAVAWLKAVCPDGVPAQGEVCSPGFDERWIVLREKLGYGTKHDQGRPWPHNALRHTFASYHYAMHSNEAKLQALMGHRSADMLHRHYRALKTKVEAEKFWGLVPREGIREKG